MELGQFAVSNKIYKLWLLVLHCGADGIPTIKFFLDLKKNPENNNNVVKSEIL